MQIRDKNLLKAVTDMADTDVDNMREAADVILVLMKRNVVVKEVY